MPDDALHPARGAVAEIVVEQVRPRQSRVVPHERLERLVAALQELMAVGGVVEEVDVGVDDGTATVAPPRCLAHRHISTHGMADR
jgi:hypothetical protein